MRPSRASLSGWCIKHPAVSAEGVAGETTPSVILTFGTPKFNG
jgi:hypothetical protein